MQFIRTTDYYILSLYSTNKLVNIVKCKNIPKNVEDNFPTLDIDWSLTFKLLIARDPLHAKRAMPDSQRYPWNLYLINDVKDIGVFLGLKVLNSDQLYIQGVPINMEIQWRIRYRLFK